MPEDRLKIVIVGAGIAGLAAGVMLREFADVTILEAAPVLKEVGAALSLSPGTVSILRRFGIHLDQKGGTQTQDVRVWSHEGATIGRTALKAREMYGEDVISIHRVDLHMALLAAATEVNDQGRPCQVLLGHRPATMDADAGVVTLADGSTFYGDVLIAADGIRSGMRPFILGEDLEPQPSGEAAYRMLLRLEDLQELHPGMLENGTISRTLHMVKGPQKKIIAYPIRGDTLLNVAAFVSDSELHESVSSTWTSKGSTEALLDSFRDFAPVWRGLLAAGKDVGVWQLRDLPPLKTWIKGRAILIGDAAHPMLPHRAAGAVSAIEDAEALSVFLRGATSDSVHDVLQRVFWVRYKRVSEIQAESRADGLFAPPDPHAGEAMMRLWDYPGAQRWVDERPDMVLQA